MIIQNIGALLIKFSGAVISYLLTIYISIHFGNEKLGYFSFFLSYSLLFTLFMKFGTDIFLMKWVSQYTALNEAGKGRYLYFKLLNYYIISGGIITLSGLFLTPYLIDFFFPAYTNFHFFEISIISIFFANILILNYEFLRGRQKVIAYTFYQSSAIFLFFLLFNLLQDIMGTHYEQRLEISYVLAVVMSSALSFFRVWFVLRKDKPIVVTNLTIHSILRQSFPFFSNNAVYILIGTTDIFFLSKYAAPALVGEYAMLVKFATFVSFPMLVLGANFAPRLLHYTNKQLLKKDILTLTRIIAFCSVFIFSVILILFNFFKDYLRIESAHSFWVFILVGIGFLFSAFCALNETCLQMLGQEKLYQKIMIAALLVNLLVNIILAPHLKELGTAIASMVTLIFWNTTAVIYTQRKLGLRTYI